MTNKSISLLMESLVGCKKVVFPCDGAHFGSECMHKQTQQAPSSPQAFQVSIFSNIFVATTKISSSVSALLVIR